MDKFLRFLFIFSATYLVLLFFMPNPQKQVENNIIFSSEKEFTIWDLVAINVVNNTKNDVIFKSYCPNFYFKIEKNVNWQKQDLTKQVQTKDCTDITLKPWETRQISFGDDNHSVFSIEWNYKIMWTTKDWKEFETSFIINKPWILKQIWNAFIYKPIYNLLIILVQYWPSHSLWFWIILLTIIIKLLLVVPNHKALKSQKAMQKIQPEINKIKEKYKWDQQKIASETMQLWKKYNTNPFWSCLPLLIQFPILIAIFFIIKDGLTLNSSIYLYSFLSDFSYSLIQTNFLWILDLTKPNLYVLPVIVWWLQYYQMHISFKWQPDSWNSSDMMAMQMQMMSKMMKYFLPLMVIVFTATLPSAIWLYWWISTAFWIIQQAFINNLDKKQKPNHDKEDVQDAEIISTKNWITKIKA